MTKVEARHFIDGLALSAPQAGAAYRTIARATTAENIEVQVLASGELLVTRSRPGHIGRQVFEDTIRPDGAKQVVQKAYDDAGNLLHHDPKGGTP